MILIDRMAIIVSSDVDVLVIQVTLLVLKMMVRNTINIPSQPPYYYSENLLFPVDSTCHWSKTTCLDGQLCNNAKYVCPPVQLNEVSPQSCGVSSYDTYQNEALSKYVNVLCTGKKKVIEL